MYKSRCRVNPHCLLYKQCSCVLNWGPFSGVFGQQRRSRWWLVGVQMANHPISQLWDPVMWQQVGAKVEEVEKHLVSVPVTGKGCQ